MKKKILSQEIVLFVDAGAALAERVTIGIIVNSARLVLEVDLNPPPINTTYFARRRGVRGLIRDRPSDFSCLCLAH